MHGLSTFEEDELVSFFPFSHCCNVPSFHRKFHFHITLLFRGDFQKCRSVWAMEAEIKKSTMETLGGEKQKTCPVLATYNYYTIITAAVHLNIITVHKNDEYKISIINAWLQDMET